MSDKIEASTLFESAPLSEDYLLQHAQTLCVDGRMIKNMSREELMIAYSRQWIQGYVKEMDGSGRMDWVPDEWRGV